MLVDSSSLFINYTTVRTSERVSQIVVVRIVITYNHMSNWKTAKNDSLFNQMSPWHKLYVDGTTGQDIGIDIIIF